MNYGPMNATDRNAATEIFDRLQRKTLIPLVLLVTAAALIIIGAPIWMFPVVVAVVFVCVFVIFGGARLIRSGVDKLRKSGSPRLPVVRFSDS
jgi:hypothetical protein